MKFGALPQIRIQEVRLTGPCDVTSPTRSEQILLSGNPFAPSRVRELLSHFASRAYRRPATEEETANLLDVYEKRLADGCEPWVAFKDALKAAMCSPAFLYFSSAENDSAHAGPSGRTELSDHGLAERLSYFLTSSMPDEPLRQLADSGKLTGSDKSTLESEARRLLKSKVSDAFVADFLDSWLNLRSLGSMPPDPKESRVYYASGLGPEMKQETQLFMRDLIDRNASTLEFLRADYTFANRDLAKLYDVVDQIPSRKAIRFGKSTMQTMSVEGYLDMQAY